METKPKRILIIDDHPLFADGIHLFLSQSENYQVSTFYNARHVLEKPTLIKDHDLVLVNLNMPNIDGFGFIQAMKERQQKIKIVVVSGTEKSVEINRVLQLGAFGFLPKRLPPNFMLNAIETALAGDIYIPECLQDKVDWQMLDSNADKYKKESRGDLKISNRQLEVLGLLRYGHPNKDIAQILNITESTVKFHIKALFTMLGINNRTSCVKKGIELALI